MHRLRVQLQKDRQRLQEINSEQRRQRLATFVQAMTHLGKSPEEIERLAQQLNQRMKPARRR